MFSSLTPLIRGILHVPFVPFSILFTYAVRLLDFDALECLDQFTGSLQPEAMPAEWTAQPYRLYKNLCDAAHFYIEAHTSRLPADPTLIPDYSGHSGESCIVHADTGTTTNADRDSSFDNVPAYELGEWYHGNQHLMDMLEEDLIF